MTAADDMMMITATTRSPPTCTSCAPMEIITSSTSPTPSLLSPTAYNFEAIELNYSNALYEELESDIADENESPMMMEESINYVEKNMSQLNVQQQQQNVCIFTETPKKRVSSITSSSSSSSPFTADSSSLEVKSICRVGGESKITPIVTTPIRRPAATSTTSSRNFVPNIIGKYLIMCCK